MCDEDQQGMEGTSVGIREGGESGGWTSRGCWLNCVSNQGKSIRFRELELGARLACVRNSKATSVGDLSRQRFSPRGGWEWR